MPLRLRLRGGREIDLICAQHCNASVAKTFGRWCRAIDIASTLSLDAKPRREFRDDFAIFVRPHNVPLAYA
jgi:hypothetical protein